MNSLINKVDFDFKCMDKSPKVSWLVQDPADCLNYSLKINSSKPKEQIKTIKYTKFLIIKSL
jgi:hypothetical protein